MSYKSEFQTISKLSMRNQVCPVKPVVQHIKSPLQSGSCRGAEVIAELNIM